MHKLFLCPVAKWTQYIPFIFKYIHPCIRAKSAFDENQIKYKIEWIPFRRKLRKSIYKLSNQSAVPIWRDCNGKVIIDSHHIVSEIKKKNTDVSQ
jgi:hypothetical protein